MTGIQLINELLKHDLNKEVVLPSVGYMEPIGVYSIYSETETLTGLEETKDGKILLMD